MIGLVDSDLLCYEFGSLTNDDGNVIPLEWSIRAMHERLDVIRKRSECDTFEYYLTGKDNFRKEVATIQPYKGQRQKEKPKWYKHLRHELEVNVGAVVVDGMEADDAVSIIQWEDWFEQGMNTCIITRDKDLHMVPGYHYSWEAGRCKEKPKWLQSEVGGLRCFYKQLLTGDSTDNILGLFGVGKKSALLSKLDAMEIEFDMYQHVMKCYTDRFGSYAYKFLVENGTLLYMLEYKGQKWQDQASILQIELDNLALQAD